MTNTNKTEKSNKKVVIIFVLVLVCSMVVGFFSALITGKMGETEAVVSTFKSIRKNIIFFAPYFAVLINIIAMIIAFSIYSKCKKQAAAWDGEDDVFIEEVERKLNYPLYILSVMTIINALLFAVCFSFEPSKGKGITIQDIGAIIGYVTFILSYVWELTLQGKVINLVKGINPEKKGNVLDMNFQKNWLESCDEAEKIMIYKSAYASYKAMSMALVIAWVVTLIANMMLNTGLFPVVIVIVLWAVNTVSYLKEASRLENNK